jgi:copper resistance protein C
VPPLRPLAALALVVALVAVPAVPAVAHARLMASTPIAGEALDQAPDRVVLEFNELVEADFGQLQVSGPDGERLDEAPPTADGSTVEAPIAAATTAGVHTVAYRIISADGHPVEGTFTYEVTEAALAAPEADAGAAEEADAAGTAPAGTATDATGDAVTPNEPAPVEDAAADEDAAAVDTGAVADDGATPIMPIAIVALLVLGVGGALLARRGRSGDDPPVA